MIFFNFSKLRKCHAPGKVSPTSKLEGFDFKIEEECAEDTSMLYDENNNTALIQYSKFGPKANQIIEYLNLFMEKQGIDCSLTINVKLKKDFHRKLLDNPNIIKKYETKCCKPNITDEDHELNIALGAIVDLASDTGSDSLKITLSVSKQHSFSERLTKFIVSKIRAGDEEKLKNDKVALEDDVSHLISLSGMRLTCETEEPQKDEHHRISFDKMVELLKREYLNFEDK